MKGREGGREDGEGQGGEGGRGKDGLIETPKFFFCINTCTYMYMYIYLCTRAVQQSVEEWYVSDLQYRFVYYVVAHHGIQQQLCRRSNTDMYNYKHTSRASLLTCQFTCDNCLRVAHGYAPTRTILFF